MKREAVLAGTVVVYSVLKMPVLWSSSLDADADAAATNRHSSSTVLS